MLKCQEVHNLVFIELFKPFPGTYAQGDGVRAFSLTRQALQEAIERSNIKRLEEKHRQGYKLRPLSKYEFSVWEDEQKWGDE